MSPLSVWLALDCHELLVPPGLPEVSVKRYSTGPDASLPVVDVMLTDDVPPAAGAEANEAGLGVGGEVSPAGMPTVVIEAGSDAAVAFWPGLLSRAVTV